MAGVDDVEVEGAWVRDGEAGGPIEGRARSFGCDIIRFEEEGISRTGEDEDEALGGAAAAAVGAGALRFMMRKLPGGNPPKGAEDEAAPSGAVILAGAGGMAWYCSDRRTAGL